MGVQIMPFYDYKCTACDHIFEEFQDINDNSLVECPKCGGVIKRLISNTSAQTILDAKELKEKIKQEARNDIQDIKNGDWEKAADYLGEEGALDFYRKR
jgi:putative FmdB family regulatory protein